MALQHLRSNTASKRPTAGAMSDGQIAVNTNATSPGLFFKDAGGAIIKVGPVHVGTTAPNSSPAGSTGNSLGEQWLDTSGGGYVLKIWDGSAWRSEVGEFVDAAGDTMTGALILPSGTAAAPALGVGSTDNGIYSPGTDQVALSTNGTGRLFVDAIGRVGVGATPAGDFDVSRTSATVEIRGTSNTSGDVRFGFFNTGANYSWIQAERNSGSLQFATNAAERLRITSAGLVGIGTSSPGSIIDIRQTQTGGETQLRIFNTDTSNTTTQTASIGLSPDSRASATAGIEAIKVNADFSTSAGRDVALALNTTLNNAKNQAVYITHGGNVGIGTTSPSEALTVAGNASFTLSGNERFSIKSSVSPLVEYKLATANYFLTLESVGGSQGAILFNTGTSTATERARIDSSGRLLVGTSSSSGSPSSGAVIQLADQFSVRAAQGGGVTNRFVDTRSGTTLNCVIDVPISSNIYSSFIGTLYICQQLTNSTKSFLAEYRVKIYNSGFTSVFTVVDSVDDSSPNNVVLTFAYSYSNRQITVTSTWTTATSSAITCTLVGAGVSTPSPL